MYGLALGIILPAMALGCASGGDAADDEMFTASRPDASAVRSMLVQDENGLEVRQIVVDDNTEAIAQALSPYVADDADRRAVDERTARALRRNGFRLVRLPIDEVDAAIEAMGGASLDMNSWHGQVLQWRDLHSVSVGAGRTIAVDGRMRRFNRGDLRLSLRSWVVPMEDGPRLQLELVPQHVRSESRYHELLGQSSTDAQPLRSIALYMLLEPGFAYVLTCESPRIEWAAADETGSEQPADGPMPYSVGPAAQVPRTLGEMMLSSSRGRPNRGMLVFTPRFSNDMFPSRGPVMVERDTDE